MSDIICITNRKLCEGNFLEQIIKLTEAKPKAIILREKDLTPDEYRKLARNVIEICDKSGVACILHSFAFLAMELGCDKIHLPLPVLRELSDEERKYFKVLGASCHSAAEAKEAEDLGCTYITAGHVFDTDCKRGLPGRGTDFLKEVCESVNIPVMAIGGISPENIAAVRAAGAAGACIMSTAMTCENAEKLLGEFE